MSTVAPEVGKALDDAIAELRGLRRGVTKDGAAIDTDGAVWKAIGVILGHAFAARAEASQLRDDLARLRRDHAEACTILSSVAEGAKGIAETVAAGGGSARLEVRYTPVRGGATNLPTAHVVQGRPQ